MYSVNRIEMPLVLLFFIHLAATAPVQDTVKRPGRTPRMQGCYYNAAHFDNGERIVTNEPCLNCTCVDSMLMCFLRVCPFVKPLGEECIEEKDKDDCCPKIWCPEVIKEKECDDPKHDHSKKDTPGCFLNEKYYPDGAMLPHDPKKPCEVCYCIRNSTSCVIQECELKVDGCTPVYKTGQCCPCRYNCTYEESTTVPPGFTVQDLSEGCTLADGKFVEDGEAVNSTNPCEHCYCMRNEVVCAIQECQAPGDNCKPLPSKSGQCCPDRYECPSLIATSEASTPSFSTFFTTESANAPLTPKRDPSVKTSSQKGIGIKGASSIPSRFKPVGIEEVSQATKATSSPLTPSQEIDELSLEESKLPDKTGSEYEPDASEDGDKSIHSVIKTEDSIRTSRPDELAVTPPSQGFDVKVETFTENVSASSVSKHHGIKGGSLKTTDTKELSKGGSGIKGRPQTEDINQDKPLLAPWFAIKSVPQDTTRIKETSVPSSPSSDIGDFEGTSVSDGRTSSPLDSLKSGLSTTQRTVEKPTTADYNETSENYEAGDSPVQLQVSIMRIQGQSKNFTIPGILDYSQVVSGIKGIQQGTIHNETTGKIPQIKHIGVKGSQSGGYGVKGGPSSYPTRLRPILPVGAIPGESNKPIPSRKRPVVMAIPGEGVCRVGKKVYQNGQLMESTDVCKINCQCINSVAYCDDVICERPPQVGNCVRVHRPGQCCPRYECGVTSSPQEVSSTTITTASVGSSTSTLEKTESSTLQAPSSTDILSETTSISYAPVTSTTASDGVTSPSEPVSEEEIRTSTLGTDSISVSTTQITIPQKDIYYDTSKDSSETESSAPASSADDLDSSPETVSGEGTGTSPSVTLSQSVKTSVQTTSVPDMSTFPTESELPTLGQTSSSIYNTDIPSTVSTIVSTTEFNEKVSLPSEKTIYPTIESTTLSLVSDIIAENTSHSSTSSKDEIEHKVTESSTLKSTEQVTLLYDHVTSSPKVTISPHTEATDSSEEGETSKVFAETITFSTLTTEAYEETSESTTEPTSTSFRQSASSEKDAEYLDITTSSENNTSRFSGTEDYSEDKGTITTSSEIALSSEKDDVHFDTTTPTPEKTATDISDIKVFYGDDDISVSSLKTTLSSEKEGVHFETTTPSEKITALLDKVEFVEEEETDIPSTTTPSTETKVDIVTTTQDSEKITLHAISEEFPKKEITSSAFPKTTALFESTVTSEEISSTSVPPSSSTIEAMKFSEDHLFASTTSSIEASSIPTGAEISEVQETTGVSEKTIEASRPEPTEDVTHFVTTSVTPPETTDILEETVKTSTLPSVETTTKVSENTSEYSSTLSPTIITETTSYDIVTRDSSSTAMPTVKLPSTHEESETLGIEGETSVTFDKATDSSEFTSISSSDITTVSHAVSVEETRASAKDEERFTVPTSFSATIDISSEKSTKLPADKDISTANVKTTSVTEPVFTVSDETSKYPATYSTLPTVTTAAYTQETEHFIDENLFTSTLASSSVSLETVSTHEELVGQSKVTTTPETSSTILEETTELHEGGKSTFTTKSTSTDIHSEEASEYSTEAKISTSFIKTTLSPQTTEFPKHDQTSESLPTLSSVFEETKQDHEKVTAHFTTSTESTVFSLVPGEETKLYENEKSTPPSLIKLSEPTQTILLEEKDTSHLFVKESFPGATKTSFEESSEYSEEKKISTGSTETLSTDEIITSPVEIPISSVELSSHSEEATYPQISSTYSEVLSAEEITSTDAARITSVDESIPETAKTTDNFIIELSTVASSTGDTSSSSVVKIVSETSDVTSDDVLSSVVTEDSTKFSDAAVSSIIDTDEVYTKTSKFPEPAEVSYGISEVMTSTNRPLSRETTVLHSAGEKKPSAEDEIHITKTPPRTTAETNAETDEFFSAVRKSTLSEMVETSGDVTTSFEKIPQTSDSVPSFSIDEEISSEKDTVSTMPDDVSSTTFSKTTESSVTEEISTISLDVADSTEKPSATDKPTSLPTHLGVTSTSFEKDNTQFSTISTEKSAVSEKETTLFSVSTLTPESTTGLFTKTDKYPAVEETLDNFGYTTISSDPSSLVSEEALAHDQTSSFTQFIVSSEKDTSSFADKTAYPIPSSVITSTEESKTSTGGISFEPTSTPSEEASKSISTDVTITDKNDKIGVTLSTTLSETEARPLKETAVFFESEKTPTTFSKEEISSEPVSTTLVDSTLPSKVTAITYDEATLFSETTDALLEQDKSTSVSDEIALHIGDERHSSSSMIPTDVSEYTTEETSETTMSGTKESSKATSTTFGDTMTTPKTVFTTLRTTPYAEVSYFPLKDTTSQTKLPTVSAEEEIFHQEDKTHFPEFLISQKTTDSTTEESTLFSVPEENYVSPKVATSPEQTFNVSLETVETDDKSSTASETSQFEESNKMHSTMTTTFPEEIFTVLQTNEFPKIDSASKESVKIASDESIPSEEMQSTVTPHPEIEKVTATETEEFSKTEIVTKKFFETTESDASTTTTSEKLHSTTAPHSEVEKGFSTKIDEFSKTETATEKFFETTVSDASTSTTSEKIHSTAAPHSEVEKDFGTKPDEFSKTETVTEKFLETTVVDESTSTTSEEIHSTTTPHPEVEKVFSTKIGEFSKTETVTEKFLESAVSDESSSTTSEEIHSTTTPHPEVEKVFSTKIGEFSKTETVTEKFLESAVSDESSSTTSEEIHSTTTPHPEVEKVFSTKIGEFSKTETVTEKFLESALSDESSSTTSEEIHSTTTPHSEVENVFSTKTDEFFKTETVTEKFLESTVSDASTSTSSKEIHFTTTPHSEVEEDFSTKIDEFSKTETVTEKFLESAISDKSTSITSEETYSTVTDLPKVETITAKTTEFPKTETSLEQSIVTTLPHESTSTILEVSTMITALHEAGKLDGTETGEFSQTESTSKESVGTALFDGTISPTSEETYFTETALSEMGKVTTTTANKLSKTETISEKSIETTASYDSTPTISDETHSTVTAVSEVEKITTTKAEEFSKTENVSEKSIETTVSHESTSTTSEETHSTITPLPETEKVTVIGIEDISDTETVTKKSSESTIFAESTSTTSEEIHSTIAIHPEEEKVTATIKGEYPETETVTKKFLEISASDESTSPTSEETHSTLIAHPEVEKVTSTKTDEFPKTETISDKSVETTASHESTHTVSDQTYSTITDTPEVEKVTVTEKTETVQEDFIETTLSHELTPITSNDTYSTMITAFPKGKITIEETAEFSKTGAISKESLETTASYESTPSTSEETHSDVTSLTEVEEFTGKFSKAQTVSEQSAETTLFHESIPSILEDRYSTVATAFAEIEKVNVSETGGFPETEAASEKFRETTASHESLPTALEHRHSTVTTLLPEVEKVTASDIEKPSKPEDASEKSVETTISPKSTPTVLEEKTNLFSFSSTDKTSYATKSADVITSTTSIVTTSTFVEGQQNDTLTSQISEETMSSTITPITTETGLFKETISQSSEITSSSEETFNISAITESVNLASHPSEDFKETLSDVSSDITTTIQTSADSAFANDVSAELPTTVLNLEDSISETSSSPKLEIDSKITSSVFDYITSTISPELVSFSTTEKSIKTLSEATTIDIDIASAVSKFSPDLGTEFIVFAEKTVSPLVSSHFVSRDDSDLVTDNITETSTTDPNADFNITKLGTEGEDQDLEEDSYDHAQTADNLMKDSDRFTETDGTKVITTPKATESSESTTIILEDTEGHYDNITSVAYQGTTTKSDTLHPSTKHIFIEDRTTEKSPPGTDSNEMQSIFTEKSKTTVQDTFSHVPTLSPEEETAQSTTLFSTTGNPLTSASTLDVSTSGVTDIDNENESVVYETGFSVNKDYSSTDGFFSTQTGTLLPQAAIASTDANKFIHDDTIKTTGTSYTLNFDSTEKLLTEGIEEGADVSDFGNVETSSKTPYATSTETEIKSLFSSSEKIDAILTTKDSSELDEEVKTDIIKSTGVYTTGEIVTTVSTMINESILRFTSSGDEPDEILSNSTTQKSDKQNVSSVGTTVLSNASINENLKNTPEIPNVTYSTVITSEVPELLRSTLASKPSLISESSSLKIQNGTDSSTESEILFTTKTSHEKDSSILVEGHTEEFSNISTTTESDPQDAKDEISSTPVSNASIEEVFSTTSEDKDTTYRTSPSSEISDDVKRTQKPIHGLETLPQHSDISTDSAIPFSVESITTTLSTKEDELKLSTEKYFDTTVLEKKTKLPSRPVLISQELSEILEYDKSGDKGEGKKTLTPTQILIGHKITQVKPELDEENIDDNKDELYSSTPSEEVFVTSDSGVSDTVSETVFESFSVPSKNASFETSTLTSTVVTPSSTNIFDSEDESTHHDTLIVRETLRPALMQSPENLVSHVETFTKAGITAASISTKLTDLTTVKSSDGEGIFTTVEYEEKQRNHSESGSTTIDFHSTAEESQELVSEVSPSQFTTTSGDESKLALSSDDKNSGVNDPTYHPDHKSKTDSTPVITFTEETVRLEESNTSFPINNEKSDEELNNQNLTNDAFENDLPTEIIFESVTKDSLPAISDFSEDSQSVPVTLSSDAVKATDSSTVATYSTQSNTDHTEYSSVDVTTEFSKTEEHSQGVEQTRDYEVDSSLFSTVDTFKTISETTDIPERPNEQVTSTSRGAYSTDKVTAHLADSSDSYINSGSKSTMFDSTIIGISEALQTSSESSIPELFDVKHTTIFSHSTDSISQDRNNFEDKTFVDSKQAEKEAFTTITSTQTQSDSTTVSGTKFIQDDEITTEVDSGKTVSADFIEAEAVTSSTVDNSVQTKVSPVDVSVQSTTETYTYEQSTPQIPSEDPEHLSDTHDTSSEKLNSSVTNTLVSEVTSESVSTLQDSLTRNVSSESSTDGGVQIFSKNTSTHDPERVTSSFQEQETLDTKVASSTSAEILSESEETISDITTRIGIYKEKNVTDKSSESITTTGDFSTESVEITTPSTSYPLQNKIHGIFEQETERYLTEIPITEGFTEHFATDYASFEESDTLEEKVKHTSQNKDITDEIISSSTHLATSQTVTEKIPYDSKFASTTIYSGSFSVPTETFHSTSDTDIDTTLSTAESSALSTDKTLSSELPYSKQDTTSISTSEVYSDISPNESEYSSSSDDKIELTTISIELTTKDIPATETINLVTREEVTSVNKTLDKAEEEIQTTEPSKKSTMITFTSEYPELKNITTGEEKLPEQTSDFKITSEVSAIPTEYTFVSSESNDTLSVSSSTVMPEIIANDKTTVYPSNLKTKFKPKPTSDTLQTTQQIEELSKTTLESILEINETDREKANLTIDIFPTTISTFEDRETLTDDIHTIKPSSGVDKQILSTEIPHTEIVTTDTSNLFTETDSTTSTLAQSEKEFSLDITTSTTTENVLPNGTSSSSEQTSDLDFVEKPMHITSASNKSSIELTMEVVTQLTDNTKILPPSTIETEFPLTPESSPKVSSVAYSEITKSVDVTDETTTLKESTTQETKISSPTSPTLEELGYTLKVQPTFEPAALIQTTQNIYHSTKSTETNEFDTSDKPSTVSLLEVESSPKPAEKVPEDLDGFSVVVLSSVNTTTSKETFELETSTYFPPLNDTTEVSEAEVTTKSGTELKEVTHSPFTSVKFLDSFTTQHVTETHPLTDRTESAIETTTDQRIETTYDRLSTAETSAPSSETFATEISDTSFITALPFESLSKSTFTSTTEISKEYASYETTSEQPISITYGSTKEVSLATQSSESEGESTNETSKYSDITSTETIDSKAKTSSSALPKETTDEFSSTTSNYSTTEVGPSETFFTDTTISPKETVPTLDSKIKLFTTPESSHTFGDFSTTSTDLIGKHTSTKVAYTVTDIPEISKETVETDETRTEKSTTSKISINTRETFDPSDTKSSVDITYEPPDMTFKYITTTAAYLSSSKQQDGSFDISTMPTTNVEATDLTHFETHPDKADTDATPETVEQASDSDIQSTAFTKKESEFGSNDIFDLPVEIRNISDTAEISKLNDTENDIKIDSILDFDKFELHNISWPEDLTLETTDIDTLKTEVSTKETYIAQSTTSANNEALHTTEKTAYGQSPTTEITLPETSDVTRIQSYKQTTINLVPVSENSSTSPAITEIPTEAETVLSIANKLPFTGIITEDDSALVTSSGTDAEAVNLELSTITAHESESSSYEDVQTEQYASSTYKTESHFDIHTTLRPTTVSDQSTSISDHHKVFSISTIPDENKTEQLQHLTTVPPAVEIIYNFTSKFEIDSNKLHISTTTKPFVSNETLTTLSVPTEDFIFDATSNYLKDQFTNDTQNVTEDVNVITTIKTVFKDILLGLSGNTTSSEYPDFPIHNKTDIEVPDSYDPVALDNRYPVTTAISETETSKYPEPSSPAPTWISYTVHEDIMKAVTTMFPSSPSSVTYEIHSSPSPGSDGTPSYVQQSEESDDVCYFEGGVYMSSEQIPRTDNCEFCFCFKGDVICLQQTCPPPIKGCYAIPIEGFCCPRFHCPVQQMWFNVSTTTTTTVVPFGKINQRVIPVPGCEIEGQTYRLHQIVKSSSNSCRLCRCDYGGIMKCDPRACKPKDTMIQQIAEAYSKKR